MDNEERLLYEWSALERPYKRWSRDFYSTIIVLAFLVSVIMFFIEGVMPVLVVWAVVFMAWAINKTQPQEAKYLLTNWGIRTTNAIYRFEEMKSFWFEDRHGQKLMRMLTGRFPGQLILVIPAEDEEKIKKIMLEKVVMEKPDPNWSDKVVKWWSEKVPLD